MSVAFAPDGTTLVTAMCGKDRTARLWDAVTGEELCRFETEKADMGVQSIAISSDGKTLATGCRLDRVLLWDLRTGKQLRRITTRGFAIVVAFSPDGKSLVFGGIHDNQIHLWDIAGEKEFQTIEVAEAFRKETRRLESIAFAPDSKSFLSAGSALRWWNASSGKAIRQLPHNYGVRSIAFSPDGKTIAVGSWDATVQLYEAATGKELAVMKGHRGKIHGVFGVAFSPDGRVVASAGEDRTVRLWEVLSGQERLCLNGHDNVTTAVSFAPDSKSLVSGSGDGSAILWDVSLAGTGRDRALRDDPKEWQTRWDQLAAKDNPEAFRVMCELARSPRETVRFFKEHLKVVPPIRPGGIEQLIAQLDSEDFETRESASATLEQLGEIAAAALRQARANHRSLEVRRRAELFLRKLDSAEVRAERIQVLRALEVLEQLGTTEARALLESLAQGASDAWRTQEAKASLDRLRKRDKAH